jgi:hypothetical protein
MHINPKAGPLRPEINRISQPDDVSARGSIRSISPVPSSVDKSDKVQISDAGRALAARGETADTSSVDPSRTARIRGRVLSGAYDTLEVVDAVARRLVDSGDL